MKKVLLKTILGLTIASSALGATCVEKYNADLDKFDRGPFQSLSRSNGHNVVHAVTAVSLNALGLSVPISYFAYPVYHAAVKGHYKKLAYLSELYESQEQGNRALSSLYDELDELDLIASQEEIFEVLNELNETGALCDGSVFKRRVKKPGRAASGFRMIPDSTPSAAKLAEYLSERLD